MILLNQFYAFPEDMICEIFEYSNLDNLLQLCSLNKKWNAWIKSDLDSTNGKIRTKNPTRLLYSYPAANH